MGRAVLVLVIARDGRTIAGLERRLRRLMDRGSVRGFLSLSGSPEELKEAFWKAAEEHFDP